MSVCNLDIAILLQALQELPRGIPTLCNPMAQYLLAPSPVHLQWLPHHRAIEFAGQRRATAWTNRGAGDCGAATHEKETTEQGGHSLSQYLSFRDEKIDEAILSL